MKRVHHITTSIFLLVFCGFNILLLHPAVSQTKKKLTVAFYNTHQLYDTIDNPKTDDNAYLPLGPQAWTLEKYHLKLENIARSIKSIGHKGPDILGLSEVENSKVLRDLLQKRILKKAKYQAVHFDSPHPKGLDVVLLYKKKVLEVISQRVFPVYSEDGRLQGSDILLVSGKIKQDEFHFIIWHVENNENTLFLEKAGLKVLKEVLQNLHQRTPNAKLLVMGEFDSNPLEETLGEDNFLTNPFQQTESPSSGKIIVSQNLVRASEGYSYKKDSATILPAKTDSEGGEQWLPVFIQLIR
ncbi:hypothetical protein AAG747_26130 [Rapidithrix thailandica]|uniref:Endonuclease/exonuclease/phosphatase domain-containing protein n=1 Tax=Rapidithrix thailandica TaxID=413964 RepID=A0AAW9SDF6_9BACT